MTYRRADGGHTTDTREGGAPGPWGVRLNLRLIVSFHPLQKPPKGQSEAGISPSYVPATKHLSPIVKVYVSI